ncbi:MAG: shikimate kinase [Flavobacteriaceae bacterium]
MKIVLLGYMGSGKTTLGRKLSSKLAFEFVDLDHYIETKEQMSIAELFTTKGEIYFRKKETEYLQQILREQDNLVLSTGGGTPCFGENINIMQQGTKNMVYLKVSIHELTKRLLKEKAQRPLIKNVPDGALVEFIGKHIFERSFFYNQANHIISCDAKSTDEIVTEIQSVLV